MSVECYMKMCFQTAMRERERLSTPVFSHFYVYKVRFIEAIDIGSM
jgi:hypothetical protein